MPEVDAAGGCLQLPSSVALHLVYWDAVSHLNPQLTDSASRLASLLQGSWVSASQELRFQVYATTPSQCLLFTWVLEIWCLGLTLVLQVHYPLRHLSSPYCSIKWKATALVSRLWGRAVRNEVLTCTDDWNTSWRGVNMQQGFIVTPEVIVISSETNTQRSLRATNAVSSRECITQGLKFLDVC